MTITTSPTLSEGCLMVRGEVVLSKVPRNVVISPVDSTSAFIGATPHCPASRHSLPLGVLQGRRFLCLYRFKIWWMIPCVGESASEIPLETQMLLVEIRGKSSLDHDQNSESTNANNNTFYVLFLPVLEGDFRSSLQGTSRNELELCIESGDAAVQTTQSLETVFYCKLCRILEKHKGTFKHIENKKTPVHLDWFGWCTWDAFYKDVNPQGIREGLQSFLEGGCSPKFLIIDDGWQDVFNEFQKDGEPPIQGTQFAERLVDIKENNRFRDLKTCRNLFEFVREIKEKYGLSLKNDSHIVSSKRTASARASEDFLPREPTLQTLHVASVAFNSLLLGEIVVPDWDMFYSVHSAAEFHASARAVGGCAVSVSDKAGSHDFKILKKLVLPDGSVLRARYAGRPTRDCLFKDPVMDGKSLLKIWNLNKVCGVIGIFNCQGEGNWPLKHGNPDDATELPPISGHVSPLDIEFLEELADKNWNGDCAVYNFNSGTVIAVPNSAKLGVCLPTLTSEIFTISPIKVYDNGLHFAPIGLLDMYNSGGAVESLSCTADVSVCKVKIQARGCGKFGAYSSAGPRSCMVDMQEVEFFYSAEGELLTLQLEGECRRRGIEIIY
ncbi:Glycosyl hydrolases 36 [Dillenia turbinata]|uniref:galactinol--sucrose galactosyltransferase n=1 Tax=Dillenia turbinata TaxID=194707 RepID=A0AAN8Z2D5_9MAGN